MALNAIREKFRNGAIGSATAVGLTALAASFAPDAHAQSDQTASAPHKYEPGLPVVITIPPDADRAHIIQADLLAHGLTTAFNCPATVS